MNEAGDDVSNSSEELLKTRFGGATVAENIKRASACGRIIAHADGTVELAERSGAVNWLTIDVPNAPPLSCQFLMHFLFHNAYARSAVPYGCRECYKVKVAPRTLRELVAAWQIAKRIECRSKWGVDSYSGDIYAGYFYASGLAPARAIYEVVRKAFDAEAKLGPELPMSIMHRCVQYEAVAACDQSDFSPEMAKLEAYLKCRFRWRRRCVQVPAVLAYWIDAAVRTGDDTYLDFTGGRRLRPKTLADHPQPAGGANPN